MYTKVCHVFQIPTGHVELREEFNPKKYLDLVPIADSSGAVFPPWKRKVMAKQMAEQAQIAEDMRYKVEFICMLLYKLIDN